MVKFCPLYPLLPVSVSLLFSACSFYPSISPSSGSHGQQGGSDFRSLAWWWHQGCAKPTVPRIIREREWNDTGSDTQTVHAQTLAQKQTQVQTEGLFELGTHMCVSLCVCLCVCVMHGSARERVCQSYLREHSSPKPASHAWHLYPGSLPASPKTTTDPSHLDQEGDHISGPHHSVHGYCTARTHTHTKNNSQRFTVWLNHLFISFLKLDL